MGRPPGQLLAIYCVVWLTAATTAALAPAAPSEAAAPASVESLLDRAWTQQAAGAQSDAVATLSEALELADASPDPAPRARVRAALGSALLATGDLAGAKKQLEEALDLARAAKDPELEATVEIERGNLLAILGPAEQSLAAYATAERLAREAGRPPLAARALANAARARLDAGAPAPEVRRDLAAAEAQAGESPPLDLRLHLGRTALGLAESTKQAQDVERTHRLLDTARKQASTGDDRLSESWALGLLGRLYESRGRSDEALAQSREAAYLAQGAPEALYRWQWQIGRILAAQGNTAAAIDAYRLSAASLGQIRQQLVRSYATGISFSKDVSPVYIELADLLLRSAPEPAEKAAHEARLLEVRETVEQLKAEELRDYFRDDCVDAIEQKIERLDQVSSRAAVIYPVLFPDRLELLLTLPSGMLRVTVPERADALEAEVRQLRQLLEKRTTREFLPHAQRVYDLIVRPWAAQLDALGVTTLVFVPDGLLRTVPMGALHDGEQFLVEKYAVAVTPGLSLTDPRPLTRESPQLLLGGLSEGVQGYAPLPFVRSELEGIQALSGGNLLLDQKFSAGAVENSLAEHDITIVHLASHAQFAENSEDSFVLTYDGRLGIDALGKSVSTTRFRERPIELLALSACETAQGSERAALGLAGVAVQAGARSALGTLWSVNDEATSRLMKGFYEGLRDPALSKAEALRRAQLSLLGDPSYAHPFFWSPFLLINNWL